MDTTTLALAYGAAALVALIVTAAFAAPIEEVLFRLLPEEVSKAWQQFVKFALFVAAFAGGMPAPPTGGFIDRNAPPVTQPVEGAGFMTVMHSIGGALAAASWVLLIFFALSLTALTVSRVYASMRRKKEAELHLLEEREQERKAAKARQDGQEGASPPKRQEPAESRPVRSQEKPARRW